MEVWSIAHGQVGRLVGRKLDWWHFRGSRSHHYRFAGKNNGFQRRSPMPYLYKAYGFAGGQSINSRIMRVSNLGPKVPVLCIRSCFAHQNFHRTKQSAESLLLFCAAHILSHTTEVFASKSRRSPRGLQLPRRQPQGPMSSYFAHEHAAQVGANAAASFIGFCLGCIFLSQDCETLI